MSKRGLIRTESYGRSLETSHLQTSHLQIASTQAPPSSTIPGAMSHFNEEAQSRDSKRSCPDAPKYVKQCPFWLLRFGAVILRTFGVQVTSLWVPSHARAPRNEVAWGPLHSKGPSANMTGTRGFDAGNSENGWSQVLLIWGLGPSELWHSARMGRSRPVKWHTF